jgi:hypothetical protein
MNRQRAIAVLLLVGVSAALPAQELVLSTGRSSIPPIVPAPTFVFPDVAGSLPYPTILIVAPEPDGGFPPWENAHGLALFGTDRAVTTRITSNEIHVIDTANAVTVSEFLLPGFNGIGTLAIDPAQTKLFAFSGDQLGNNQLYLVDAPFTASSPITTLTLPGNGGTANSRAVAFDKATGRAFIGHSTGISVMDPPYASIAFTIAVAGQDDPRVGQLVTLSSDGNILATTSNQPGINILHAPFSASSVPIVLTPPGAQFLAGAAFTPDGSALLVTDAAAGPSVTRAFVISAPFDEGATIEALPLADDLVSSGLEDVDVSADGQLAALTGNDVDTSQPLVILKAPFTAAGVTVYPIHLPLMPDYTPYGGRGAGTARFRASPLTATPQFSPDAKYFFAREGDSGLSPLRIDVHLSHASNQTASIDWTTVDSSAIAGVDYVAASGTLVFAPGETRKSFSVDLIGNTTGDFNTRLFDVRFSNAVNASISQNLGKVRCEIADEENSFHYGIMLTPDHLPDGRLATPYSATLASSFPGDTVWRVQQGELPPGLTLDEDTGAISGTPTYPGTYWFVVGTAHTPGGFYNLTIPRPGDRIFADGFDSGS